MPVRGRITLKNIAETSKMSVSGVSMALRNDPSIPKETCERVQSLAEKMGYQPNPYVSALMRNRGSKRKTVDPIIAEIAYINHSESFVLESGRSRRTQVEASYKSNIRDFYLGALNRASQQGYQLSLFNYDATTMNYNMMNRIFKNRSIRGFILSPMDLNEEHANFDWEYFASATVGHSQPMPMHRAVPDYSHMLELILQHLKDKGYQRIGLVLTDYHLSRYAKYWAQGYAYYSMQQPLQNRLPIYSVKIGAEKKVLLWVEKYQPEVIISSAYTLCSTLQDNGIETPFIDILHQIRPPAGAYFDQNAEVIGQMAIDLVTAQLMRNEYGIPQREKIVMVKGSFENADQIPAIRSRSLRKIVRNKSSLNCQLFITDKDLGSE